MNSKEKEFIYNISQELEPPQSYDDAIYNAFKAIRNSKKVKYNNFKFKFATAFCSLFIITGVVFAKDIENFFKEQFSNFGMGDGVTTAIENGYIGKSEDNLFEQNVQMIENNEIIGNINVKSKVDEFLMTDSRLSLSFYFEFDNKINDYVNLGKIVNGYVDYEGSHIIELSDMVILDENNNVLFYDYYKNDDFKQFCEEHNIDYNNNQTRFDYSGSDKEFVNGENTISDNLVYEITSPIIYPKSKKLNIYLTKISIIPNHRRPENTKEIILHGNWEFHLDVPEVMYDRENSSYRVISCDNDNFEVYETKLTETCFEIGLNINNIEEPAYPVELHNREEELSKIYTHDEIFDRK